MSIIERLKPLFSQLKRADNYVFSWSGYGTRILLYGSVLVSLVLPTYDFGIHQFSIFPERKHKYNEAKQYIATLNKAQKFYFAENGKFTNSIDELGFTFKTETTDYIYQIISANGPIQTHNNKTNMVPSFESVTSVARPKKAGIRDYIGVVFAIKNNQEGADSITTISAICQVSPNKDFPSTLPTLSTNLEVLCPPNSEPVTK